MSTSGDTFQSTGTVHFPGGCSDYAACAGDPSSINDYHAGHSQVTMNGMLPANGVFWLAGYRTLTFQSVPDGLSNTFFVGEKHIPNFSFGDRSANDSSVYNGDHGHSFKRAGVGAPLAKGPTGSGQFGSYHADICQFVMGDGSVRAIAVSIDLTNLGRLANREDGQVITYQF
jgi:hypothetical protein